MRLPLLCAAVAAAGITLVAHQQTAPRTRPSPGCVTTKVYHVYSECQADGFWHVVTDERYSCAGPGGVVRSEAVRVRDDRTEQACEEGAEAPSIRQLLPFGPPGTTDQPMADGTFVMRECLSDGQWYWVTYLRMTAIDGTPRIDPKPINFERTGESCKPPRNAPPPPTAMSTGQMPQSVGSARITLQPSEQPRQGETAAQPKPSTYVREDPILAIANLIVPDEVLDDVIEESWGDPWIEMGGYWRYPRLDPREVEPATQDQHGILDDIKGSEKLVIAANRPRPSIWSLFQSPFAVLSASQGEAGGLEFLFTSLGRSTGEAFDVQVVNNTGKPVELRPGALVLQPLKDAAARRLTREFTNAGSKAVRLRMNGYCLQFLKLPPKAGMIFTAAPAGVQQQFAGAAGIFRAASVLNRRGLIKPTGNAESYFHSIRQWAWWTREQKFTEATFTSAMLEYTKKNLVNAKQPWTKEAEAYVRATSPKRWADITNVLRLADRAAARKGAK